MARTGIRPPAPDACKAMCCDCSGYYADGRYIDCQIRNCSFYTRMKYRKLPPDLSWLFGKWTKRHETARRALGLTQEQYIAQHIVRPNRKYAIGFAAMFRAKCFDCCNNFHDGRMDCEIPGCPIYYWMPYRELLPDLNWLFDFPYTRHHNDRMKFERLTREEYIAKYIAKTVESDDEPCEVDESDEEQVVKTVRVRILAP